jgi:Cu/Zn superoxide dismutase
MRHFLSPLLVTILLGFASAAQAAVTNYTTTLSGAKESPPNSSPGTGTATVVIDDMANTMALHVDFSGLTAATMAAHIHCCTAAPQSGNAPVATALPSFPMFPSGVTYGTYDKTFDLMAAGTYNPAFVTAHGGTPATAEADLLAALAAGSAYLNIHTSGFSAGEVRGFLLAAPIPEPGHLAMLVMGLAAIGSLRRWRPGAEP